MFHIAIYSRKLSICCEAFFQFCHYFHTHTIIISIYLMSLMLFIFCLMFTTCLLQWWMYIDGFSQLVLNVSYLLQVSKAYNCVTNMPFRMSDLERSISSSSISSIYCYSKHQAKEYKQIVKLFSVTILTNTSVDLFSYVSRSGHEHPSMKLKTFFM